MKPAVNHFAIAVGALLMATLLTGTSFASCGDSKSKLVPQAWDGQSGSFLPISASSSDDPIVGMWHVTFTAQGNEMGPPDGAVIDNALVVWHADGTEIMNSARPPQDGDFCLGVWKKIGKNSYKLNHFAWLANDTANAPSGIGNPTGPTRIVEEVKLGPDGKHFTGRFTLSAYDPNGVLLVQIVGVLNGTRITLDTGVGDLL